MIILELLFLVFAGRVVIQTDFDTRGMAMVYGTVFSLVDFSFGLPLSVVGPSRFLAVALAEVHFRSLRRFSGLLFLLNIALGVAIPIAVIYAQSWLQGDGG